MVKRIRREKPPGDYRALIQREGEKPFDAKIIEIVYREEIGEDGELLAFNAEGTIFDNDGQLVPLSEVEGVIAILDPGETIADILQPKKQARRRRLMRYGKIAMVIIGALRKIP